MAYSVKLAKIAERQLGKLDPQVQRRVGELIDRLESLADPRAIGEALHGDLKDFWKYRAGDWRLVASIHDDVLVVEVIEIVHRSKAY